ncbi:MAG: HAD-IIIA family hydrolase [Bacilli bacterium]|nr:HAD-IIIA family hydrolase [Bacilli bacterium]
MGTAGCFHTLAKKLKSDFVYIPEPRFFDVDFKRLLDFHKKKEAMITVVGGPSLEKLPLVDVFDQDIIVSDEPNPSEWPPFHNNIHDLGIYVVSSTFPESFEEPETVDFEEGILQPTLALGAAFLYRTSEYVKPVSQIERIEKDIDRDLPRKRNLSRPQKAIFLDRDGTINHFGAFVVKAEMLNLEQGSAEAIALIDDSEYLPICITNQPIVERGETTLEELERTHARMAVLLEKEGAYLQDLYFCPHNIDHTKPWNAACECRKPKIGMLLQAKERYNVDLSESWFIGDTTQDVQTGINGGCHTALLLSGDPKPAKRFADAKPDITCFNLLEAIKKII